MKRLVKKSLQVAQRRHLPASDHGPEETPAKIKPQEPAGGRKEIRQHVGTQSKCISPSGGSRLDLGRKSHS